MLVSPNEGNGRNSCIVLCCTSVVLHLCCVTMWNYRTVANFPALSSSRKISRNRASAVPAAATVMFFASASASTREGGGAAANAKKENNKPGNHLFKSAGGGGGGPTPGAGGACARIFIYSSM